MADDYEVGYRKPPRAGQFKKGQSGNPRGRPKLGRRNTLTIRIELVISVTGGDAKLSSTNGEDEVSRTPTNTLTVEPTDG